MVAAGAHAPRALVESAPASSSMGRDLISILREQMGSGARTMGVAWGERIDRLHGAGERNAERPVPKVGRRDSMRSCWSRMTLTAVLRDVHGVGNSWARAPIDDRGGRGAVVGTAPAASAGEDRGEWEPPCHYMCL
jgi:hypothetical protein